MNLRALSNRVGNEDGRFILPQDGWYHLVPKGEFPHANGGKPLTQVLDDTALTAMVNRFKTEAAGTNFAGLLIDYDHFSYDLAKSSESAGWLKELENRSDGLWGRIAWTDSGEAAVKNGRYRFISPVWREVSEVGKNRVRPERLDTLGLTNSPNLKGMAPLSNRSPVGAPGLQNNLPGNDAGKTKGNKMKRVLLALGLSEDASEESALTAVDVLKNRVSTVEAGQTELKNRAVTLETENKALLETQVETDLAQYKDRIAEGKKESWKKALLANRASAIELLEGITPAKGKTGEGTRPTGKQPLHNRATAGNPASVTEGAARTAEDQAKAIEKEVQTYKLANRCSYEDAWNQVYQNKPELFATAAAE